MPDLRQRMATPRLNECRTKRSLDAAIARAVEAFQADLLAGKAPLVAEEDRKALFRGYLWAATAKPDNPCLRRPTPSCLRQSRPNLAPEHRPLVQRGAEIFGVPVSAADRLQERSPPSAPTAPRGGR
jgi:hypothetical protein